MASSHLCSLFNYHSYRPINTECLAEIGQDPGEKGTSEDNKFKQIMNLKTVHLLAFFILVYVGVEVTIGGWFITACIIFC
jgi:fucose permease